MSVFLVFASFTLKDNYCLDSRSEDATQYDEAVQKGFQKDPDTSEASKGALLGSFLYLSTV